MPVLGASVGGTVGTAVACVGAIVGQYVGLVVGANVGIPVRTVRIGYDIIGCPQSSRATLKLSFLWNMVRITSNNDTASRVNVHTPL